MRRRVPAALAGLACALALSVPGGAAHAQGSGPLDTEVAQETGSAWPGGLAPTAGPVVELPPLPSTAGESPAGPRGNGGTTGVQTLALALAGGALVAGVAGLTVVTRRGRGDLLDGADGEDDGPEGSDDGPRPGPTGPVDGAADSRRDLGLAGGVTS